MLSFTVRMRFPSEAKYDVEQALVELTRHSRLEPGCISYIAHFIEAEPDTVLIYEQYADDAALDFHRGTPHFHQYAIGVLYQRMRDRNVEQLIAVC